MKRTTSAKVQSSTLTTRANKKPTSSSISNNEQLLKTTLRLLGVTHEQFQKQTKTPFKNQFFPKTLPNSTNSKQFFFICFVCAQNLFSNDERQQLSMWYPPRTVNEQIEFKKVFFKSLQRMEAHGIVPKNLLLSKMVLMGEGSESTILEFFRIFSELSLRALYLEKYSKKQRLIQISVNNSPTSNQNDINKFYLFPFNECATNTEPPFKSEVQAESIKKLFKIYIERYRKKILSLRIAEETESISPQTLMSQILEQKQLATTLQSKVNKSIYSENRAFDRRVILDKNAEIWKEIANLPCNFISEEESPVLKAEGQTAKLLSNWRTASGTPTLIEFNQEASKIAALKQKCQQKLEESKKLKQKLLTMITSFKE